MCSEQKQHHDYDHLELVLESTLAISSLNWEAVNPFYGFSILVESLMANPSLNVLNVVDGNT